MKKWILILFILLVSGCASFQPEKAIEDINNSETYTIESTPYYDGDTKQITVVVKKDNKDLIFAYYQEEDKRNNFITYFNQDKNIPVERCYVLEPTNVANIERQAYIKYLDEIKEQYLNELEEMNLNEDEFFQIIQYYYNNI